MGANITIKEYPFYIVCFLFNPLLTIVGMVFYGLSFGESRTTEKNKNYLLLFGIFCCIFVSLINMTKVPEVDLYNYIYRYKQAGRYDLLAYLRVIAIEGGSFKEPLYNVLSWCINKVYFGNEYLFKFTISMMQYTLLITSLIYFGKRFSMRIYVVITGIVFMCFFPSIFTHSLNLIRQTLANCILCFVMVRHFFYNKREWIGMVSTILIHSTSMLFLPLLLFPAFGKPIRKAWIWYMGAFVLLLSIQFFAAYIFEVGSFDTDNSIGYALDRAKEDTTAIIKPISFFSVALLSIVLGYVIFLFFKDSTKGVSGLRRFLFVLIFLSLFILINLHQDQLAGRMMHYAFNFVPFILMLFLSRIRNYNKPLLIMNYSIIILFTIYVHIGYWTYTVEYGGWFTPVFVYNFY